MDHFSLISTYTPSGDQPRAIEEMCANLDVGICYQTLMGITGSGKTFSLAHTIARQNRPTLVLAPNKTLAAQLFSEFREFFPKNRVRYFVSYYDYYQPEAYVPSTDTYIEKDSNINAEIDKMRHAATKALLESRDTIVVGSVSCIYGLGAPEEYFKHMIYVEKGQEMSLDGCVDQLISLRYEKDDLDPKRGKFRRRGDQLDVYVADQSSLALRIQFFGDEIEELFLIDVTTGEPMAKIPNATIYPASHYVTDIDNVKRAIKDILAELEIRVRELEREGKVNEAFRLNQRCRYDVELMQETGFCPGIENYSRHLAGRKEGDPPTTLIDYFPDDFLMIIDESHVTIPQLSAMYRGDRARKMSLVNYGFRLPSALDNRPLQAEEFWQRAGQVIFVSATPGEFELERSEGHIVEQVNRPTGLLDPQVEVRPATQQIDDLVNEIHVEIEKGNRVLVTTLTKKSAERLSSYLIEIGIKSRYMHSSIDTVERVEILRGLRLGEFDVLIGINLLREGLDLVEVGLVAILDADKEGFLRSYRSLIQTIGRAARNLHGRAILYGDTITGSMREAIDETNRRRIIQEEHNRAHGIVPRGVSRPIEKSLQTVMAVIEGENAAAASSRGFEMSGVGGSAGSGETTYASATAVSVNEVNANQAGANQASVNHDSSLPDNIELLTKMMMEASLNREYEVAIKLRDKIRALGG